MIYLWTMLTLLGLVQSTAAAESCLLDADLEMRKPIQKYQNTLLECRDTQGRTRLATREFTIKSTDYLLIVDADTLQTSLERRACWSCAPTTSEKQVSTRFLSSVDRYTRADARSKRAAFRGVGLKHSENAQPGSFLTADLCPSHRPLDRKFLEQIGERASRSPLPVALSVSGSWLVHHEKDFEWLKDKIRARRLDITWVNHSDTHPYRPKLPDEDNFLRLSGVNIQREILAPEARLIQHGVTPSVFFRFPGLISDARLMGEMRRYSLIPLDTDSWIAKSELPRRGSILLVHLNGNEPSGLTKFIGLFNAAKIPEPFGDLIQAPRK